MRCSLDVGRSCRYEAGKLYSGEFASNASGRGPPVLRAVVDKSRRALLRYVPPQVTRHLPAQFKGPAPTPGPPPGISIETLDSVCAEALGGRIRRCAHQHVARWKKHGTFRLYVVAENGTERTFIFKDEIYTVDEIPALRELSVLPGPPEFYVYTQSFNAPLGAFLPTVFWCAEIEPARHFRYLMEDLRLTHRKLHFKKKDLLFAVRVLAEVHKAMKLTLADNNTPLIRYDQTYSKKMIEYSRSSLEEYSKITGDAEVSEIIRLWPTILEYHEISAPFRNELNQPIHGDYTLAHVHWRNGVDGAKIVDWEWAGIGLPHADLAAILKWADPAVKREGIRIFAREQEQLRFEEHARLLRWCLLERKLLDAGFFARQQIAKGRRGGRYFRRSVADVLAIAKGLRHGATVE